MNRLRHNLHGTLGNDKQETFGREGQGKLKNIIKTFRQNNFKLMQKLQECERIRDNQQINYKRKPSEKYFLQKNDFSINKLNDHKNYQSRPYSQIKTDRKIQTLIKENCRKQNIASDFDRYVTNYMPKSQDIVQTQMTLLDEKNFKLVKIKANKLVPLSMDKLKEKLKML